MTCLVSVLLMILTSFLLFIYVHVCRYLCLSCGYAGTSAYVSMCTCKSEVDIERESSKISFFFYFLGQTILLNLQQTKSGYPCLNLLSNRIMSMTTFYFIFLFFPPFIFIMSAEDQIQSLYLSGKLFANGVMSLAHDFIFEE